jgi:transposase
VYKAGKATGDYYGQMNSDNFEKWVNEKVIPNLATPSVIAMDNAPYHGKQIVKPPTKLSLKKDMLEYLRRHGVPCEELQTAYQCDTPSPWGGSFQLMRKA